MRHAIIFGRRRQGKSTLALALAVAQGRRPVIIFDTCNQYHAFPEIPVEDLDLALENSADIVRIVPYGDPAEAFSDLGASLIEPDWPWIDYTLIVDEAVFLQRPQAMHPDLARFVRQGPDEVTVIQTIHRPSECHSTVRALATDIFFFQCYLRRDLEVIEETYGTAVSETVAKLPHHHVLHFWLDAGGEPRWGVWDSPEEWYLEIGDRE